ncbi:MAG: hypothetical protein D6812_02840 [Deltaproteobacteria bacterium]|nr:MAG: hypothetical protein D6812_02840 [Deltaproteobacteria bacterium]
MSNVLAVAELAASLLQVGVELLMEVRQSLEDDRDFSDEDLTRLSRRSDELVQQARTLLSGEEGRDGGDG